MLVLYRGVQILVYNFDQTRLNIDKPKQISKFTNFFFSLNDKLQSSLQEFRPLATKLH